MALSNAELENIRKSAEQAVMQKRVAQAVSQKRAEQNRRREAQAAASSSVPVEVKTPSVPELSLTEKQKRRRDSANLLQQMTSSDPATEVQKAEIRAQKAEKVYGDYLQSEERAQKQAEFDRENRKNTLSPMNSVPGAYAAASQKPEEMPADEKEKELEAVAGYYRTQANKTKDEEITRRNMEEFNSWPEEDRTALERYIIESNQEKYNVNADSPMINARSNAADLFRKYGDKKVREIAESYTRIENENLARDVEQAAREGAGSGVAGAIGHSALSVGANTAGAITGPVEYLNELLGRTGQYSTLDPNNIGGIFNTYSGAVRSQVAQDIAGDGGALRKGLSYGYQGIMGAADTLARAALGGGSKVATLGLAASGSFGQTMSQASAQGATPAQAVALATANAFIETGTEYLPLDNLLKTAKGGAQGAKAAIQNALKRGGMEIIEEEASFLGSLAAETAILREKSSYKQQIGELVANGMSYQQAKEQADRQLWHQALDTAIVSGISGEISSLGASVAAEMSSPEEAQPDTRTPEQRRSDSLGKVIQEQMRSRGMLQQKDIQTPTYEALIAKGDIPVVKVGRNTEGKTYAQLKQDVINKADQQKWYDKPYVNNDTGMPVFLTQKSFTHAFSNLTSQFGTDTILAMENVQQLIENAVLTHVDPPKNPRKAENRVFTLFAAVEGENGIEPVKLKVKEYEVKKENRLPENIWNYFKKTKEADKYNTLYDLKALEVIEIESAKKEFDASASGAESTELSGAKGTSNSTIKVADLLSLVKGHAEKYIPDATQNAGENTQIPTEISDTDNLPKAEGEEQQNAQAGIKGTGAAERGFSPKYALIDQYGAIPEGENPVRADQLPVSTTGDDRVSRTARTVLEAEATPDEFAELLEQKTVEGGMSYIPITNDQTTKKAIEKIRKDGWDESRMEWSHRVRNGQVSADLSAMGALLLNNAANSGDKNAWLDILDDYRKMGTSAAQGLQALRILKTLEPSDKLYMIRRSVRQMVDDMHLDTDITIDRELSEAYQNAKTDAEADAILKQIQKDVASQIPSTAMDKWTALRYLNMLGNFCTQVRNVASNVGAQATYRVKDTIGAALEMIVNKAIGGKLERTKSFTVDKALKKAASDDFDNIRSAAIGGGKYADGKVQGDDFAEGVQEKRKIFSNPVLENYRKATNWAMNNSVFGDEAFSKAAYSRALAGYLKANGVTAETIDSVDDQLMDRARSYAIREAQEATFRDNNTVSDWISKIGRRKDTPKAARIISEGIMPFRKTPANVLVRAEEFSPLGLINSAVKTVQAAKGEISGAEVINSWAKTLTGSGLVALGAFLGNAGYLIGGPDDDEDKAEFDKLNGYQNYALMLPDGTNLTIDFLSPMAMPLFIGAQIAKIADGEGIQLSELEPAFLSLADPMIQMSMLQGVNDTLDGIKYSENNMGQFLLNAATSYLTQGITNTLLGRIERSGEETRMTTYVDKESQLSPWVQRQLGKASQKIPGWDFQQTPYVSEWGEEQKSFDGLYNYLYNMLSPAYISKAETNTLTDELYRLDKAQSEHNVFPARPESTLNFTGADGTKYEGYSLNANEFVKLEKVQGQTAKNVLLDLINRDGYKALTDSQKAEAVQLVYDYAREKGRVEAITDYPGMSDKWMEGIEGKEAESIIRKVAGDSVSKALEKAGTAIRSGWDTEQNAESLEEAYSTYKSLDRAEQKRIAEGNGGAMWEYIKVRESGVTTKQYLDLSKVVEGLKPAAGSKNVSQAQKAEAAVKFPGLTEKQREAVVKMYVSDAQDKNMEDMKKLGFSTSDYMTAWKIYNGESGKGKKQRTIEKYMDKFGVDEKTAKTIYEIYG